MQERTSSPRSNALLPRVLCLHGGGTNATIFYQQMRALRARLEPYFRLCFVDAPFVCQSPGPDVTAVYERFGPFRRWLRWQHSQPEIECKMTVRKIDAAIEAAMGEDDLKGARGEWVGVLGFSQGATVAGSLLLRHQRRMEKGKRESGILARAKFRFGILLAGSAPLVSLEPDEAITPGLRNVSQLSSTGVPCWEKISGENILRIPTVHIHGLQDPGLPRHQQLLERYCENGSTRAVGWRGDHKVPAKRNDVIVVMEEILDVASEVGLLSHQ